MPTDLPERAEDDVTEVKGNLLGWILLIVIFYALSSVILSCSKRFVNECGQVWGIERVFTGDLFCPVARKGDEKKKKQDASP